ncbi:hypothetical protein MBOE_32660 [Mycolicibacterium boenickei]|uniref:Secreted protein n=1 Tax=Mycolicibacterium boenickei TaxID=146017 RepID=A0ABM7IXN6_9MYCO|nr:hypothetical protein MBOE_32660 [Mycolicibacterium boenickei]
MVGGAVVSTGTSAGGGGALGIPVSSLVLTGVRGTVLVVVVDDRDDAGFVGATGVSRSGCTGSTEWCDVVRIANTSAPMATTPPMPATTIAVVLSYQGVLGGPSSEPTQRS